MMPAVRWDGNEWVVTDPREAKWEFALFLATHLPLLGAVVFALAVLL